MKDSPIDQPAISNSNIAVNKMELVSYAKWILSGEHTVVRGGKAIVFPLNYYKCSLFYEEADELIIDEYLPYRSIFISLLHKAAALTNTDFHEVRGKITEKTDIPVKSGLGSSAAICRNVANIFMYLGFCDDVASLARCLEDTFHGKSSGLDISVAMINNPLVFQQNRIIDVLEKPFLAQLMLSYSGRKSCTSRCADIIETVHRDDSAKAVELDAMMNQSSDLCECGVRNSDFNKLREGINLGNQVFHQWNLCDASLDDHMNFLTSMGAVASKPIGSGLGGYVVSLWEKQPKKYGDICLTFQ
jgi:mevalonate kinase